MEQNSTPRMEISREVRFAVVMHGGLSLGSYINGVTQELFHMVRATSANPVDKSTPLLSNDELLGTERVYRRLGQILNRNGEELRNMDNPEPIRSRFVVDILSGTSAGGINAIYLAKALANGQSIDPLTQLWMNEADAEKLINDSESVRGLDGLEAQDQPNSLLNSQRMYRKLLDAFDSMEVPNPGTKYLQSPFVEELDLFVTATNLRGLSANLRLADKMVSQERHRTVFHFQYGSADEAGVDFRNDFLGGNNPFLAFTARCTSASPFAFEPMRLMDIDSIVEGSRTEINYERWKQFFPSHDHHDFRDLAFVDGRYVDNKPFANVTDALATRRSSFPTSRKLVYIEPPPSTIDAARRDSDNLDAMENVATTFSLARSETIHEDLKRILARNRLSEQVERTMLDIEEDVEDGEILEKAILTEEQFAQMDLKEMVETRGVAYAGYHRVRIGVVKDEIAAMIARAAGFDTQSDESTAIRILVQVWRDQKYTDYLATAPEKETQNRFLLEYDLSYRLRRMKFVLDKLHQLRSNLNPKARKILKVHGKDEPKPEDEQELRAEFETLETELRELFHHLHRVRATLYSPRSQNPFASLVADVRLDPRELIQILNQSNDWQRLNRAERLLASGLQGTFDELATQLRTYIVPHMRGTTELWRNILNPQELGIQPRKSASIAIEIARHYYHYFDHYDSFSYPILYFTGVKEEFGTVEVTRISPEDAPSATSLIDEKFDSRQTQADTLLDNVGALLNGGQRRNDFLWGRLDGVEQIINTLYQDTSGNTQRQREELIRDAQYAILSEELRTPDQNRLIQLLADVLANTASADLDKRSLQRFVDNERETPVSSVLESALRAVIADADLPTLFSATHKANRHISRMTKIRILARSVQLTGRMFENIADKHEIGGGKFGAWFVRIGKVLGVVVEAAVPNSLPNLLFRNQVRLLYLFEVFIITGSTALEFGGIALSVSSQLQTFGLLAFAITVVVHVGVLGLGDWMRGKDEKWRTVLRVILVSGLITLLFLALVGVDALIDLRGRLGVSE